MSTYVSHHVNAGTAPPKPQIHTYPTRAPIASVDIDGGAISIAAVEPQHLFDIADAFIKAAEMLAVAIAGDVARGPVDQTA